MPWHETGSVAVIVARQFNPSIVSQLWLVKHGILDEEGTTEEGTIFADSVVQVRSPLFHMLLLPDQMQFVPNVPREQQQKSIIDKVGTIIKKLPETPYAAVGLNFNWHLTPHDNDISRLSRELFFMSDRPLYQRFAAPDAGFGAYLSKDFVGFRLRLTINPISLPLLSPVENRLQFAFNFHCDLKEDPCNQLLDLLNRWDEVRQEAEDVLDTIRERYQ